MKKYLLILFFLFPFVGLDAQPALIKKRVETPAPQVKTPTTKVKTVVVEKPVYLDKPVYIESNTNKFTLKLTCTASAKVLIDGEDKGIIAAGAFKKILLSKGKYYLTLISTANSTDQIKQTYEVANVNTEDLLEIDLQSIIDKRVLEEERAKVKAPALKNAISDINNNMISVEGGSFKMGGDDEYDGTPVHTVSLSSYYIGKYEVTQIQWEAIMGTNPSRFEDCYNCPVENVSWHDIQEFLQKLNVKTGKNYRLPTEAEWEYAARGGNKSNAYTYSGSNNLGSVAWHEDNSGRKTHPVGQKQANELGIYDMSGNVWEWCSDWYSESYYSSSPNSNPTGPDSGTDRVLRGGSWNYNAQSCRVAYQRYSTPEGRNSDVSFRLALVP